MEHRITFNVTGHVTQRVRILKEGLTVEGLIEGLKRGRFLTSVYAEKIVDSNNEVVAEVVENKPEVCFEDWWKLASAPT
jgi:hypothetical protein